MTRAPSSLLPALAIFRAKAKGKLKVFLLEIMLRPLRPPNMLRFGTYYGGWWIPEVDPDQGAAICVGAGTDVTFDLELHRLGYRVYAVDPTPSAVEFVTANAPQLSFLEVGVWHETGEVDFVQDAQWTESWAIEGPAADGPAGEGSGGAGVNVQRLQVVTVKDLIALTGEPEIAILKLDIEGAEHAVIESMIRDDVLPRCLCVEFDDHRLQKVLASHKRLLRSGYELWQIEGLNHMYVRH